MLCEQKQLLRLLELVCLAAIAASLAFAFVTWHKPAEDFPVLLCAVAGMAVLMLTFLPACVLGGEYVKTAKKPSTWRQRTEGLNSADLSTLLRWAPALYKAGAVAAILISVATTISFGSIKFNSESPVNPQQTPAVFLYLTVFYLLALPILGSASRMPGSYAACSGA